MTATQQMCLLLAIGAAFQVWMLIFRPEQYQREVERRDRNIRGVANATASVVRFLMKR